MNYVDGSLMRIDIHQGRVEHAPPRPRLNSDVSFERLLPRSESGQAATQVTAYGPTRIYIALPPRCF